MISFWHILLCNMRQFQLFDDLVSSFNLIIINFYLYLSSNISIWRFAYFLIVVYYLLGFQKGMLVFDVAQFDGILKKITEFNNAVSSDSVGFYYETSQLSFYICSLYHLSFVLLISDSVSSYYLLSKPKHVLWHCTQLDRWDFIWECQWSVQSIQFICSMLFRALLLDQATHVQLGSTWHFHLHHLLGN